MNIDSFLFKNRHSIIPKQNDESINVYVVLYDLYQEGHWKELNFILSTISSYLFNNEKKSLFDWKTNISLGKFINLKELEKSFINEDKEKLHMIYNWYQSLLESRLSKYESSLNYLSKVRSYYDDHYHKENNKIINALISVNEITNQFKIDSLSGKMDSITLLMKKISNLLKDIDHLPFSIYVYKEIQCKLIHLMIIMKIISKNIDSSLKYILIQLKKSYIASYIKQIALKYSNDEDNNILNSFPNRLSKLFIHNNENPNHHHYSIINECIYIISIILSDFHPDHYIDYDSFIHTIYLFCFILLMKDDLKSMNDVINLTKEIIIYTHSKSNIHPWIIYFECQYHLLSNKVDKAKETLSSFLQWNHHNHKPFYPLLYMMGIILFKENNYDDAIHYFNQCIESKYYKLKSSYHLIGLCYAYQKKYQNSIHMMNQSLNIDDHHDNYSIYIHISLCHHYLKQYDLEIKVLNKAIDKFSSFMNDYTLILLKWRIYQSYLQWNKHSNESLSWIKLIVNECRQRNIISFNKGLILDHQIPNIHEIMRDYIYSLLMNKNYDEAINECDSILNIYPYDVIIMIYKADALICKGDMNRSYQSLMNAMDIIKACDNQLLGNVNDDKSYFMFQNKMVKDDPSTHILFDYNQRKIIMSDISNNLSILNLSLKKYDQVEDLLNESKMINDDGFSIYNSTLFLIKQMKLKKACILWFSYRNIDTNGSMEYYQQKINEINNHLRDMTSYPEIESHVMGDQIPLFQLYQLELHLLISYKEMVFSDHASRYFEDKIK